MVGEGSADQLSDPINEYVRGQKTFLAEAKKKLGSYSWARKVGDRLVQNLLMLQSDKDQKVRQGSQGIGWLIPEITELNREPALIPHFVIGIQVKLQSEGLIEYKYEEKSDVGQHVKWLKIWSFTEGTMINCGHMPWVKRWF